MVRDVAAMSRREFLEAATRAGTAVAGAAVLATPSTTKALGANERLKIGVVGVAGRGSSNLQGVSGEEIVALCDIDGNRLADAGKRFPKAKLYADYRKVLDHDLDALVVSTPDHMHAFPVVAALQAGLDVYCEKPMAHNVWEVRQMREWAKKQKAVTQLGTQIHAGDNYRRAVEIVQSGTLGPVERVHIWFGGSNRSFAKAPTQPVPPHVDYDLWLGAAPEVPFSDTHFHFNWRYWWAFGNGAFGDFVCHYGDLPFWALKLNEAGPTKVVAQGAKGHDGINDVPDDLRIDWYFPQRGDMKPVHVTWYMGKYRPADLMSYGEGKGSAVLFEGTKGKLVADYGSRKIFMNPGETAEVPEPWVPNSIGHHAEFLKAVRERGETTCNFDYSGALTEAGLLGNVAYRVHQELGGKEPVELAWDAAKLTSPSHPQAAQFLRREYRKGWELPEA